MTESTPPAPEPTLTPGAPRRRGFRPVPLRLLLPNIVTLLALCLGLTAIRFAMDGKIDWAVMAIAGAAVLDGLDGRIARALKGTSRFGAELDSLADFVNFGVAPALVLFVADLHAAKSFGWVAALMFAMACALRLARFNVMLDDPDQPAWRKTFFVGMPAPAGAVVGLLPIYLRFALGLGAPSARIAVIESAVAPDGERDRDEIGEGERDQRLHREDEHEHQRRGDGHQKGRQILGRHAADRLAGKVRHATRHKEGDRQRIEALDHRDAGARRAES